MLLRWMASETGDASTFDMGSLDRRLTMFRWWPCLVLHLLLLHGASAAQLPPEFVNLRDVAPDILQDIRYAGADNFTGQKVPGYDANECVLKRPVAEALKKVDDRQAKMLQELRKEFEAYKAAHP